MDEPNTLPSAPPLAEPEALPTLEAFVAWVPPSPRQSPSVVHLAIALGKVQRKMAGAAKDSVNPHFKSKYASLAAVWTAWRDGIEQTALEEELTILQFPAWAGRIVVVTTQLIHSSGEWIESVFAVPVGQLTTQGVCAAVTYARRYALSTLVGIAPEDDDGEEASRTLPPGAKHATMPPNPTPVNRVGPPPPPPPKPPLAAPQSSEEGRGLVPPPPGKPPRRAPVPIPVTPTTEGV